MDHATIKRGVITYSPLLEEAFDRRKRLVGVRWRMEETYIRVKGEWHSLDRAVAKHGPTIDFLRTEHRDQEAARRFLKKAIRRHGIPETITIDGSAANAEFVEHASHKAEVIQDLATVRALVGHNNLLCGEEIIKDVQRPTKMTLSGERDAESRLKRLLVDVDTGKDPLALDTYGDVYAGIKSGRGRKIRSIICTAFLEYFGATASDQNGKKTPASTNSRHTGLGRNVAGGSSPRYSCAILIDYDNNSRTAEPLTPGETSGQLVSTENHRARTDTFPEAGFR